MAEVTVTPQPPKVEIQKPPEKVQNQPMMENSRPFGQAEQNIANRITKDGDPDIILKDIERTPKFIRDFSKEQSAQERQQTARDIRATRKEHFEQKKEVTGQQTQVQTEVGKKEATITEQRQKLETLKEEIDRLSGPWFSRLLNYTRLRGLNADLQTAEGAYQNLQQEETKLKVQEQTVSAEADKLKDAPKLEEGRQKLQSFYRKEKVKWANADYTKEDIARYFTEAHLASLSTEDYTLLLKRFPSEMVTHVTRQGIRDHVGGDFHTAGLGEHFDNFRQLLQDGRLRSRFGVFFRNGLTKEAVTQALDLGKTIRTKENAKILLSQTVEGGQLIGGESTWADSTAIHLAAEEVADGIYGGERGNEIFFAFPSAHIAAEHVFSGSLGGYRAEASIGSPHNDQWIWAKDNEGLGINAGIVFIPVDARVDPRTGSKYELTDSRKPIEQQGNINDIVQLIESDKFEEIVQEIDRVMVRGNIIPTEQEIQALRGRFVKEFGISNTSTQEALIDYNLRGDLIASHNREQFREHVKDAYLPQDVARRVLMRIGTLYKVPEKTVSSKDYWEDYFAQNPSMQSKRIVYYEGGNPTKALRAWRESSGITKKAQAEDLGFPEKLATDTYLPSQAIAGMDRFKSIAEEVIDDYFSQLKAA